MESKGKDLSELKRIYDEAMRQDHVEKSVWRIGSGRPHPWKDFKASDPKHHNALSYQYLVHSIQIRDGIPPKKAIDFFKSKPAVSTSLITNNIVESMYGTGLILNIPYQDIVAARPNDSACAILNGSSSRQEFDEAITEANDIWGVFSPEELLMLSGLEGAHNEIYAITGVKYSNLPKIKIEGVFVLKDTSARVLKFAQELENILKVPLVKI